MVCEEMSMRASSVAALPDATAPKETIRNAKIKDPYRIRFAPYCRRQTKLKLLNGL
jgi:hypothetical protein